MKTKLSITVNEENVRQMDRFVEDGTFRNKSHAVEFAIVELLKTIMENENADNADKPKAKKEKK